MKRKDPPSGRGGSSYGDPEQDLSRDQLAKLGALALEFNYAEVALERILFHTLNIIGNLWVDAVKRMGSLESKTDLAKISLAYFDEIITEGYGLKELAFTDESGQSIGAFTVCKKYRDLVLHSVTYNITPPSERVLATEGKKQRST